MIYQILNKHYHQAILSLDSYKSQYFWCLNKQLLQSTCTILVNF